MEDQSLFQNFSRVSVDFEKLFVLVEPIISKKDTNYRKCISSREREALTSRFMAFILTKIIYCQPTNVHTDNELATCSQTNPLKLPTRLGTPRRTEPSGRAARELFANRRIHRASKMFANCSRTARELGLYPA
nr:unnamed protein product [Callosobruchus analis]